MAQRARITIAGFLLSCAACFPLVYLHYEIQACADLPYHSPPCAAVMEIALRKSMRCSERLTGNDSGFSASPGEPLLFYMEQDQQERYDRSAQEPAVVAELEGVIRTFCSSVNAEQTCWGAP